MEAVFIDLKKAFDTIEENLLLEKLENVVMRGHVQTILKFYLSEKKCVRSVEFMWEFLTTEYGVPQVSVLGSLLFLVYLNDIQEFCGIQSAYSSKEKFEVNPICSRLFFAKQTDKNAPSEFESNQKNLQAEVILPNNAISQKTSLKYLGVHFDEKLIFNRHILK